MADKKLTHEQISQLGGLRTVQVAGPGGMALRAARGGDAVYAKYGKEYYVRMAHKRWGRLQDVPVTGPVKHPKAAPTSSSEPSD